MQPGELARTPIVGFPGLERLSCADHLCHSDWERVVVVWGKGENTKWVPSRLMISQHNGYQTISWDNIENTFNTRDGRHVRGGKNGLRRRDHAKVYVAWSKHAQYQNRQTRWFTPLSQLTDLAYRSDDWWYFPVKGGC